MAAQVWSGRCISTTLKPNFASAPLRRPQPRRCAPCSGTNDRHGQSTSSFSSLALTSSALTAPFVLLVGEAAAKGGEFGLLEGRTFALVHPVIMAVLFGSTCYAGYLGWQWRSLREVGADLKELKKQLAPVGEDGVRPPSPVDDEIANLEKIRKELASSNLRERHHDMGNILLAGGVTTAVAGCLNTYMRTGKLFPGPHLFAGAGIVVLWALAASLVPYMQKGNESARIAHIGLNTLNVLLFAWQIPTGWEIVLKVFQFTTWP